MPKHAADHDNRTTAQTHLDTAHAHICEMLRIGRTSQAADHMHAAQDHTEKAERAAGSPAEHAYAAAITAAIREVWRTLA